MTDCKGCIELAAEREAKRREEQDRNNGEERKPCGEYHPLPCGLDKKCPVPVDYTAFEGPTSGSHDPDGVSQATADEVNESQAAYDAWQEDKREQ